MLTLSVGFERGKMIGRSLRAAILRAQISVKAPLVVLRPMRAEAIGNEAGERLDDGMGEGKEREAHA